MKESFENMQDIPTFVNKNGDQIGYWNKDVSHKESDWLNEVIQAEASLKKEFHEMSVSFAEKNIEATKKLLNTTMEEIDELRKIMDLIKSQPRPDEKVLAAYRDELTNLCKEFLKNRNIWKEQIAAAKQFNKDAKFNLN